MASIRPPVDIDPDAKTQESFDHLADAIPGWQPNPAALEVRVVEATSPVVAQVAEEAASTSEAIFRRFGVLVGITPRDPTLATGTVTVTAVDSVGHTLPAGTIVQSGEVAFETTADGVIPPASSQVAGVPIVAILPGEAGSGISGTLELINPPLVWVQTIVLDAQTTGGTDGETDDEYLLRLSDELTLMAPRPIVADDFAVMARGVDGVHRALALDGYNPGDDSTGNERMVTVALVDESGEPVSGTAKTAVDDLLQSRREVNFIVHVIDGTYTEIDVAATFTPWPEYDPADVQAAVIAAVEDYLDPANWGRRPFGDGTEWINTTKVRIFELVEVANRVDGVRFVDTLTIEAGGVDVTLTEPAPLTRPGTITATAT